MKELNSKTAELVRKEIQKPDFTKKIESLLMDILSIDTSPTQPVEELGKAEDLVFSRIAACLKELDNLHGISVKHFIAEDIESHRYYSKVFPPPGYEECPSSVVYANRYNLLYLIDTKSKKKGKNVGLNAHIDVVAPYLPPVKEGTYIRGRGSADDKGNVMVIIGALLVLNTLREKYDCELSGNLACMFVIDEELGGNGSLSVAMDHRLQENYYDSLLVLECAGNRIYPGNRGAVFFRIEGSADRNLLEAFSYGIVSVIMEGEKIRNESSHPLFPQRPVYTCTGILGPFGKHPSGICEYVDFLVSGITEKDVPKVIQALEKGLDQYITQFGDKKNVADPLSGKPKIDKHYTIDTTETDELIICVYGSGGHMGSLPENDAAITKWAFLTRELIELKKSEGSDFSIRFSGKPKTENLIFEGAQSFLPCHRMEDVAERLKNAFYSGVEQNYNDIRWIVTFDKLHNEAFVVDPGSSSVKNAVISALEAGTISEESGLIGWDASCDARIFAKEYPGMPVITTGPGDLNGAHSDKEAIFLPDLYDSIVFTVLYILRETNSALG